MFAKYIYFNLYFEKKTYFEKNADKSCVIIIKAMTSLRKYFVFILRMQEAIRIHKSKFVLAFKPRKPAFFAKVVKKVVHDDFIFDKMTSPSKFTKFKNSK